METYHGYVRTPGDAIKLFEACRLGLLPRVQRRLSEKERQSIRSGSVFVWDEREAGMRRWTDGKSWSASRVSGSFLTYREMEGKRGGGFGSNRRGAGKTPDSGRGSDEDQDDGEPEGYRYKADGLMKQSFSITTSTGQHLHLISYYSRPQPGQSELPLPSTDPSLRGIVPVKGMYPESSMGETNQTPALTRAPMQQPPFMMGPQHAASAHHQLPYQYPYAHGYGWPMSPAATPPFAAYGVASAYPPGAYPPPLLAHLPPPAHPHYASPGGPLPPAPGPYDNRVTLPPPHTSKASPYQNAHGTSPPRTVDSPRHDGLQAAAQAGLDRGITSDLSRSHLPPIENGASRPPLKRNCSPSPPRLSGLDSQGITSHKSNLTALLRSQPAIKKEEGPTSTPKLEVLEKGGVSEDARALRMLDRKFCI